MSDWRRSEVGDGVICFRDAGGEELRAPALIGGRYEVDGVLSNSGGCGVIYTAGDRRLRGRRVLVKARRYSPGLFLYPEDAARRDRISRLRRQTYFEWQCLLHFRRKGESRIPSVNDVCEDFAPALLGPHRDDQGRPWRLDDRSITHTEPFVILQAIPGRSLEAGIDQAERGPQREAEILRLGLELATILGTFHRPDPETGAYYIYQDLKPSNVIISHDEFFTLIDFGAMTLVMDDETRQPWSNWEDMGSPGLGTWGYKAPEMDPKRGQLSRLDRRVDYYSLGATLYHLLTRDDPSRGHPEYGPLPLDRKQFHSPYTYDLVRKALQPDREMRYAAAKEMELDVLKALKELRHL